MLAKYLLNDRIVPVSDGLNGELSDARPTQDLLDDGRARQKGPFVKMALR